MQVDGIPLFQMVPVQGKVKTKVVRYEKEVDEDGKVVLVDGRPQYNRVVADRIDDAGVLVFFPKGNSIRLSKREAIELKLNRSGATSALGLNRREIAEADVEELERLGNEIGVPMFSEKYQGIDMPQHGTGEEKMLVDGKATTIQGYVQRKCGIVEVATIQEKLNKKETA